MEDYDPPTTSAARQESFASMEDGGTAGTTTVGGGANLGLCQDPTTDKKLPRESSANSTPYSKKNGEQDDDDDDDEGNRASESRWTTLANMEASQKQESTLGSRLLEQLVNDLNCTYQASTKFED